MTGTSINILVAEDDANIALAIQMLVKKAIRDASVCVVNDGEQALNELRKRDYSLVISDWNMPRVSGMDLLKKIRSDECCADLPFLMLTARHDLDEGMALLTQGFTNFIGKPYENDDLIDKVRALLE